MSCCASCWELQVVPEGLWIEELMSCPCRLCFTSWQLATFG